MKDKPRIIPGTISALVVAVLSISPALALSPPPPLPEDLLADFYQAMNGDDWHRNDDWLDPDIDVCDWYGITCVTEGIEFGGFEWIGYIRLPNNNLQGELSTELIERMGSTSAAPTPSVELDLSGNAISGTLPLLPLSTPRVRLGNNRTNGPLPAIDAESVTDELEYLRLNSNAFEGEVPSSWETLSLMQLDLSNNKLEGSANSALEALDPAEASLLDLSDNAFSGELPAWITELTLEPSFPDIGSINICWTGLSVDDKATREWLGERHVGGADFESCMSRERRTVGPEVSGSWYDPARDGEGYSLMLLEDGTPLVYWFTHLSLSRQMWLVGTGRHEDTTLFFDQLLRTEGRFGEGYGSFDDPVSRKGEQRMDGLAGGQLHLSSRIGYSTSDLAQPDDGVIVFMPNPIDFRTDLVRLSELAGTTCDNQSEFQQFSGAWYNPERAGEGFVVEVLPDDRAVVYWFAHRPDESGDQAWIIGQGNIGAGTDVCLAPGCEPADAVVDIDPMFLPVDTGQNFPADTSGVENLEWGKLQLAFGNEGQGNVGFESRLEEYGNDGYPIERLAHPMLAECPQGERQ